MQKMDSACHEYSRPASSSPEKTTPAAAKQRKPAGRKVVKEARHPVSRGARQKNGGCEARPPNKKSKIWASPKTAAVAHEATVDGLPIPDSGKEMLKSKEKDGVFEESGRWSEVFVDEEAVFNMPALLDGMAEGMLLTPLGMKKGFTWSQYDDDDATEFTLWLN